MGKSSGKSLSVIIPAYNEEKNIVAAVSTIEAAVKGLFDDYELIILNDASSDRTGEIADALAKRNRRIRAFNFKANRGFGAMYQEGVMRAGKDYLIMIPGDNEILGESITNVLAHTGESDIVLTYITNQEVRPLLRRIVSVGFKSILNLLFGLNLRYYNGLVVYEASLVKKVKMTTSSFAFQAEILVRLLKEGHSYREVPMMLRPYDGSRTKAFSIANLTGVLKTMVRLFFEMHFGKKSRK